MTSRPCRHCGRAGCVVYGLSVADWPLAVLYGCGECWHRWYVDGLGDLLVPPGPIREGGHEW